jgi:NADH:ubiquinone oxidoreductase subunit 5 (subunit L)/multisubunit Na+/H+ antiporter MnhA subunit
MAAHADLLAPVAVLAGLLLFVGATGKSAQIPLYVWLPDAMAGPTPVSALIHAATMVTAGVYMMARMNFLYDLAPTALAVVAVIGAATALLAATIGLAQTDIKKVLAYSTVSQLGYMFMACGVGAYGVGIFHVLTHAFFKALLFMGAGSVIHALHHEQDMRNMGGLKDKLPWTFRTMMVATLAIAGVFPFAGFFSKDEILYKSFLWSPLLWIVGFAVAGLTAFYMARLMAMTFFGECRVSKDKLSHVHESPWMMVGPLVVLAVLSFAGGWMGWPAFMGGNNAIEHWLEPVFHHEVALDAHPGEVDAHISGTYASADAAAQEEHGAAADDHGAADSHGAEGAHGDDHGEHNVALEWGLAIGSFAWALLGLGLGFLVYTRRPGVAASGRAALGGLAHRLVENKYYVDEIYDALVVWPINRFSETALWRFVDVAVIDGLLVNGISRSLGLVGQLLRLVQNGMLRWYAWSFAAGVLVVLFYLSRHVNGEGGDDVQSRSTPVELDHLPPGRRSGGAHGGAPSQQCRESRHCDDRAACRLRAFAALVAGLRGGSGNAVRGTGGLAPGLRNQLLARRRRDQSLAGAPDHLPRSDHRAQHLQRRGRTGAGIHDLLPAPADRHAWDLLRAGPGAVLRVLGSGTPADGADDRHLGRSAPYLRLGKVCHLHDGRIGPDAGGSPLSLRPGGQLLDRGDPAAHA